MQNSVYEYFLSLDPLTQLSHKTYEITPSVVDNAKNSFLFFISINTSSHAESPKSIIKIFVSCIRRTFTKHAGA